MDDITGAVLETARLRLRRLRPDDFGNLCLILQDAEAMYAYEHAFPDREVREWLDRQLGNYERYGFGLWAVELRGSGEFIGQCGLTMQGNPREQPGLPRGGRAQRPRARGALYKALLWGGNAAYRVCKA